MEKIKSARVTQMCNNCGMEFDMLYWENGDYTYFE